MFNYRYDFDTDSYVRAGVRMELLIPLLVIVISAIFVMVA